MAKSFIENVNEVTELLRKNPTIGLMVEDFSKAYSSRTNHQKLIYQFNKHELVILDFIDMRSSGSKKIIGGQNARD